MRERMLAGALYIAEDPELAELSSRAFDLVAAYNATSVRQGPLRRRLLEELLGSIGEGTEIRPPLYVDYGSHVHIGARCFCNYGLVAADVAALVIGDDVQIGPHVQLLTPTHPVESAPRRAKWESAKPYHDRRQRVARRWHDRAARGDHRGEHGRRRRSCGHERSASQRRRCRQPGTRHPHPGRSGTVVELVHVREPAASELDYRNPAFGLQHDARNRCAARRTGSAGRRRRHGGSDR